MAKKNRPKLPDEIHGIIKNRVEGMDLGYIIDTEISNQYWDVVAKEVSERIKKMNLAKKVRKEVSRVIEATTESQVQGLVVKCSEELLPETE